MADPDDVDDGLYLFFDALFPPMKWSLEFAWIPHTCNVSKKRIWLEYAYRGTRRVSGPGEPVKIVEWLTTPEFLIKRIKNEI
jgi:hypothetical protein